MHTNFIKDLLNLKEDNVIFSNGTIVKDCFYIDLELERINHKCPKCSSITNKVHDYRTRKIKHGNINGYKGIVYYKRRRYVCNKCKCRFPENNTFVDRFAKISNLTNSLIINDYIKLNNYKQIALENNVSSSTVMRRIEKHVSPVYHGLPEVLSFDEFKKTNDGRGKYAFCIADPVGKKVLDVIVNRRSNWLTHYFNKIPFKDRKHVKTVIIDLWAPYRSVIRAYFPNAKIVADKFHYLRNLLWAFNDVRVRVMNSFPTSSTEYRFLKKHWKTFNKPNSSLNTKAYYNKLANRSLNEFGIHDYACSLNKELEEAFVIKDFFHNNMNELYDENSAEEFMNKWILMLRDSSLPEYNKLANTFVNWKTEIINSLYIRNDDNKHYTNGFIEGVNNLIKVIKRLAFGFRKFENFKRKIMVVFNKEMMIKA